MQGFLIDKDSLYIRKEHQNKKPCNTNPRLCSKNLLGPEKPFCLDFSRFHDFASQQMYKNISLIQNPSTFSFRFCFFKPGDDEYCIIWIKGKRYRFDRGWVFCGRDGKI